MKTTDEKRETLPDMSNEQLSDFKAALELVGAMPKSMDDLTIECLGCGEKYPLQEHPHKCK